MKKILKTLENTLLFVLAFMTLMTIALGFYQVLCRYVLGWSLKWIEEVIRHTFCAIIFMGISLSVKDENMVTITVVSDAIRSKSIFGYKVLRILQLIIQTLFFGVWLYFAVRWTYNNRIQLTSVTKISYSIIYSPVVIGGTLSVLYLLGKLVRTVFKGAADKDNMHVEGTDIA